MKDKANRRILNPTDCLALLAMALYLLGLDYRSLSALQIVALCATGLALAAYAVTLVRRIRARKEERHARR